MSAREAMKGSINNILVFVNSLSTMSGEHQCGSINRGKCKMAPPIRRDQWSLRGSQVLGRVKGEQRDP